MTSTHERTEVRSSSQLDNDPSFQLQSNFTVHRSSSHRFVITHVLHLTLSSEGGWRCSRETVGFIWVVALVDALLVIFFKVRAMVVELEVLRLVLVVPKLKFCDNVQYWWYKVRHYVDWFASVEMSQRVTRPLQRIVHSVLRTENALEGDVKCM